MRVAAFVILCCALQHITSEIIDDSIHNILNDKNKYETKNETTSDEFGINQNTGEVVETVTTHKEFLLKNGCGSDLDEGDVKKIELLITQDDQGRERIYEEDTIIKKNPGTTVNGNDGIPVTSSSSSSASAASQTLQTTGSAASASTAASSNAGSSGIETEAGTRGAASGKSAAVAAADNNGRAYENSYGLTSIDGPNDSQGPHIIIQNISSSSSSTATSVAREHISGAKGPTTGDETSEVTPAINDEPGPYASTINDNEESLATSYSAASATSRASRTTAGSAARTQVPASGSTSTASSSGPVSKPEGTAPGKGLTYLDFYGPGYNGENDYRPRKLVSINNDNEGSLATSYSAASATSRASRTTAGSAARTQGVTSGSTSTASSSGPVSKPEGTAPGKGLTYLDFYGPGYNGEKDYRPQKLVSIINDNEGSLATSYSAASAASGVSGSGTTPGSAARTQGSSSGSTSTASSSGPRSGTSYPESISCTQGSSDESEECGPYEKASGRGGVYGPGSGSSGSPGNSPTKIGDKTAGTQRPESGPVPKPAGTAPGKRPTYLDFYGPGYNGENDYRPQKLVSIINDNKGSLATSYSAASATSRASRTTAGSATRTQVPASGSTSTASSSGPVSKPEGTAPGKGLTYLDFYGPGYNGENDYRPQKLVSIINDNEGSLATSYSAASAALGASGSGTTPGSAARTQGSSSGSTSTASSSGPRSGTSYPESISCTQGSSEESEECGPYEKASGRGGVYGPGSGSSGSPGNSPTKIGDKTAGTQRPESGPVPKPAGTAPGKRPTYLDFYGPGYNGENDYRPQKLISIINDNKGSLATSYSAASATSRASRTTAGSAARTQVPASGSTSTASSSGPVSKPEGTAPGKGLTYLDFYGPGYNGENDYRPRKLVSINNDNEGSLATSYSAASAASAASRSGTTPGSAARTQGSSSGSTSTASSSGPRSGISYPESISCTQGSSEESEECGPYEKASGRGGVYGPGSGSSGSPGNSPTKIGDKTAGTQRPESGPVPKLAGTAPGKRPTYLDFYGPGYNGENDYRPQKLISIINDNKGSLATSYSAASAATGASGSGTTPGSAARTQGSSSGSTSTASSSGPRSGTSYPESISCTQGSSEESEECGPYEKASGRGGVYGPGSGSSGSPGNSPTKIGDKTAGTQRPESGPVPKLAGTAPGKRPTYLDFYGPGYNGENDYRPQKLISIINDNKGSLATSYSAASAASGASGSGTTPGSAARTQGSSSGSTSTASSSGPRSGTSYPESISCTQGSSEESEECVPYEKASGRGGVYGPGSGSSGSPGNSPTKIGDKTAGTQRPESGPVPKPAGTAPGKRPTYLDFYGPGYNGENDYRPQKLVSIINDNKGSLATSYSAASATSRASRTTAGSATRTQVPASGSTSTASSSGAVSKPEGTAPGKGLTYLDFYGPGYNGENDYRPQKLVSIINDNEGSLATSYSAASAASGASGSGTTPGSAARTQGSSSGSTSTASSSGPRSGTRYPESISCTQGSSEESEECGPYEKASGRGGVYGPGSGSSGSPGNSPTKIGDKTAGTQRPESGPVPNPAGTAPGKRPTYLDFYGPGYNGENDYRPQKLISIINDNKGSLATSYSAASATSRASRTTAGSAARTQVPASGSTSTASSSGPVSKPEGTAPGKGLTYLDFYGPGYNGENDYRPQKLVSIINDNKGSLATSYSAASATSRASRTTAGSATRTQGPSSGSTSAASSSGPVSKPAGTAPGKGLTYLDFYGLGYNGENDYRPQKLVSIINDNKGSLATSYSAASATSRASRTTAGSAARTQVPASESTSTASSSGPVSKPEGTAPGKGLTYLDFYRPGYNGENDYRPFKLVSIINDNEGSLATSYSAASAASGASGSETTAGSAARTQGSSSGSTSAASSSNSRSDTSGPRSISDKQGSSGGSEEGGPYENGCRLGIPYRPYGIQRPKVVQIHNTNRPVSGSSGTPGTSPTTKEGVSGTQRPGSGRASRPVDSITRNNQNELGPDSYGPGYYGPDYSIFEELTTISDNKRGSESSSSPAARAPAGESAAGIPDAAPTTSGVASGVTSGPRRKRVRQACRLKSSQFVLRLGRKGQPCTFCY